MCIVFSLWSFISSDSLKSVTSLWTIFYVPLFFITTFLLRRKKTFLNFWRMNIYQDWVGKVFFFFFFFLLFCYVTINPIGNLHSNKIVKLDKFYLMSLLFQLLPYFLLTLLRKIMNYNSKERASPTLSILLYAFFT